MEKTKEIWRDAPNYEGYYQASNLGRIRSLSRYVKHSRGGQQILNGRIMKQTLAGRGYYYVYFCVDGVHENKAVHSIIASTFLSYNYSGGKIVVDHIDNNKLNNNVKNLQIISQRENCSKDKSGGTSKYVGVSWYKKTGKWSSCIKIDGKNKSLGQFEDEKEAAQAYRNELNKLTHKK
jgi:hypothetical protein